MRIVIVSQYYRPENVQIPISLADELRARGHSVRVITGYPNYPAGKIFQGYKQRFRFFEKRNGVLIRRVPLFISHSQNAIGRMANYLSFAFSSLMAFRFVAGADVVYVYATQMTAAIGPSYWKRLLGVPFVLHVQDLWPESVTGSSLVKSRLVQRFIEKIMRGWLRRIYVRSAAVVAIAPTMKRMLIERGAPASGTHVVLNWADEPERTPPRPAHERGTLTVTYAGTLGHFQNLEIAIKAAGLVQDLTGFQLNIVGSGAAENALRFAAKYATNVCFVGRVPNEEMAAIYEESDFQLVTLKDLPIFVGTIPSKLQGSFAAGVPVITAVAGDVSRIVLEADAGLAACPDDVDSLATAFRSAYALGAAERSRMGMNARRYYAENMSKNIGVNAIESVLISAATRHHRR